MSVRRGGRAVLRDVSLRIAAGETVALVGRSGSGKTTLLRLINRLLEPDAGQVIVEGQPTTVWDPIALRRRIGYVIQDAGLFPHMTVAANIGIVPRLLLWEEARVASRIDELLAMVDLEPAVYRGRWPDELAGGQRQRVGLARALAADPPVLLMDEPFGALDSITRAELHAEFRRVQSTLQRTVVLVTHDLAEAEALADRIAVLHDGRIILCDTPAAVLASTDPRVAAMVLPRRG
ncbi:MAG TPA: ATP-binding cassette domain-containing protein [Vicinamibacterales bacterium]|nr:ATP-binding cassette domain-containing protein [Vicinamibacterales bacterium]